MYTAVVRKEQGPWELRSEAQSAREAKRALAKKAGLALRVVDSLPLGRSKLVVGGWHEVKVEARGKS